MHYRIKYLNFIKPRQRKRELLFAEVSTYFLILLKYSKIHNYLYIRVGEVGNADRIWARTPQNLASGWGRTKS